MEWNSVSKMSSIWMIIWVVLFKALRCIHICVFHLLFVQTIESSVWRPHFVHKYWWEAKSITRNVETRYCEWSVLFFSLSFSLQIICTSWGNWPMKLYCHFCITDFLMSVGEIFDLDLYDFPIFHAMTCNQKKSIKRVSRSERKANISRERKRVIEKYTEITRGKIKMPAETDEHGGRAERVCVCNASGDDFLTKPFQVWFIRSLHIVQKIIQTVSSRNQTSKSNTKWALHCIGSSNNSSSSSASKSNRIKRTKRQIVAFKFTNGTTVYRGYVQRNKKRPATY